MIWTGEYLGVDKTRRYGCVACQCFHYEDTEPELFNAHLMRQSKHGWTFAPPASRRLDTSAS